MGRTNTSNTNPPEKFNDGREYQISKVSSFKKVTGSASRKAKNNKKELAISTSTSRDNVTLLLKSCLNENPDDVFSFISTGDLVKKKKPSPDYMNWYQKK